MIIVADLQKEKAEILSDTRGAEVLGILLPFAVIEGNLLQLL